MLTTWLPMSAESRPTRMGWPLPRAGGMDGEIFLNIRNGIKGTAMPGFGGFPQEKIWQMVSYIRSLSGGGAVAEKVSGDAATGEKLFFGKAGCAGCHEVNARGGRVGPELSGAGAMSAADLRAKLLGKGEGKGAGRMGRGP